MRVHSASEIGSDSNLTPNPTHPAMNINVKDPAFWVGLVVTILSVLGLVTGDEGSALTEHSNEIAIGVIGLWKLLPSIFRRYRNKSAD